MDNKKLKVGDIVDFGRGRVISTIPACNVVMCELVDEDEDVLAEAEIWCEKFSKEHDFKQDDIAESRNESSSDFVLANQRSY